MTESRLLKTIAFLLGFMASFCFFAYSSYADPPAPPSTDGCSMEDFAEKMGLSENSGNLTGCTTANNGKQYCGLYQMSAEEMAKYGLTQNSTREEQTAAFYKRQEDVWAALNTPPRNAAQYLGKRDQYGTLITKTGILAAAHLGGNGGASSYLRCSQNPSGSGCPYNPGDGRDWRNPACKAARDAGMGVAERQKSLGLQCGTYLSDYMNKFEGENGEDCGASNASASSTGPQCAPMIENLLKTEMAAAAAAYNDIYANALGAPVVPSQVNNTPCKSIQLQNISNQFAYAPAMYGAQVTTALSGVLGPVSGIVNNFAGADMAAFISGSGSIGGAIGTAFYKLTQGTLSSIMASLGLADSPFASALCGIMVDTVINFIQCEVPLTLPSLGQLTGSLNDLLPEGCAGDAIRGALYGTAATNSLTPTTQGITFGAQGLFSPKATPALTNAPNATPNTPTGRRE